MENRLVALKLFLDALGVEPAIDTLDDRKRVQKGVYLGQALGGLDLSYRFGWYLMGPYSPALTRDYYALNEAVESGEQLPAGARLRTRHAQRLSQLGEVLRSKPEALNESDWLELVGSLHYLIRVKGLDRDRASNEIRSSPSKSRLSPFLEDAYEALEKASSIAAAN